MENSQVQESGKTAAIICYFTLIGWIIGLVLHSGHKARLSAFHLRQMLGFMILVIAASILARVLPNIPTLGLSIENILSIGLFILWIIGLIAAIRGQEKPMPFVGALFQRWFAGFAL
jgi:uncharacterized membrane protein